MAFIGRVLFLLVAALPLFGSVKNLTLNDAINILKKNNLELKIAHFNEQMKAYEIKVAKGQNYGKLDATVMGMRSNDAGNVFGFKLQSREASFGDFGFSDFMGAIGQGAAQSRGDFGRFTQGLAQGGDRILSLQPKDLNYPSPRNHFQTKFSYQVPLYTGGKLTEYARITEALYRMSKYDTTKLLNEKIFQTKKAFYDISLVEHYVYNLSKIIRNIVKLESIVRNMKREGYATNIDILEVQARKAEAESMYNQAKLNRDLAYQFLSFLLNTEVKSIKRMNDIAPMPYITKRALKKYNVDIQKALLGLKVTQMALEIEKANFLPTIGGFGEYGSADNRLWNDFFDKDAYTVGVQLQWNLFHGGIDKANLEKAKLNYLKVNDQVELAKKGILLKARKLKTEILSADADIRNYKKRLRLAKKVYENYRAKYKEGLASISDLLMKQSKELEVLLKLLTAKNKRNTKVFELEALANKQKSASVFNVERIKRNVETNTTEEGEEI
ncbi:MAG: TolC family protein [Sulfurovum sp.]|nr:MAG: TolC family protein [Sulfurovum sp.]